MTLSSIVDEGAKVRGRAFAGVAAVVGIVAVMGVVGGWGGFALPEDATALPERGAGVQAQGAVLLGLPLISWAAASAPTMQRVSYTWTGNTSNAWNNAGNWSSGAGGYPDDASDDATLSIDFDVVFDASRTIDDLTVVGILDGDPEPNFDAGGLEYTLTCDMVSISGSGNATVTVHVNGKAAIETN